MNITVHCTACFTPTDYVEMIQTESDENKWGQPTYAYQCPLCHALVIVTDTTKPRDYTLCPE